MPLSPGDRLGPYQVVAPAGAGGMGEVYQARDTRLDRIVAIKVSREQFSERFEREARAAAQINHPNICTLHDVGPNYLVMEFVEGAPLKGPLPLDRAVEYAAQILDALDAAHSKGIVHRDLKPANIMVTRQGIKLLDFGLARQSAPLRKDDATLTEPLTREGQMLGTLHYMSPEQLQGRDADARSDLFSFGCVLYELLAGKRAFEGDNAASVIAATMDREPAELKVAPSLDRVIRRTLAKDPERRFQTARDLKAALLWATEPAPASTAKKADRRWPWIAAAVAAIGAGAALWIQRPAADHVDNPLANAQFTRFTDFPGSETDAAISRDGKFVAFRSDRDGPVDTFVSQVGSGRFLNLTHGGQNTVLVRNEGFTPDGSEVWLSGVINGVRLRLVPLTGGTARAFLTEHAMNVAWSPDGSRIVFHNWDEGDPMFVADRAGANAQQIFRVGSGRHNHFPTWSPDGQWIYFVSGLWDTREMDLWRIRPSGGTPERLTHHNSDVRSAAPLDNRTLLYVSPDQNGAGPWLWALDTERKISSRITTGLEVYSSIDASGDGRRLAATVSTPTANLWTIPIGDRPAEERDIKPLSLPSVRALSPRYGGTSLFYLSSRGGGDGLWRYRDGLTIEIWKGSDGPLFDPPGVSFDGTRVAVILRKQGKHRLYTLSGDGGDVRPLAESIDISSSAGWSPDGKWIVAGGTDKSGPGLFKIPVDGGEAVRLTKGVSLNPAWSPDGSVIVYMGASVGVTGPLLMVRPDGAAVDAPAIQLRVGGARYRFVPGREELVYVPGSQLSPEDFWLLDLATRKTRRLSNFENHFTRTFDITPDGKEIVFDRLKENSDIVLIDLPERSK